VIARLNREARQTAVLADQNASMALSVASVAYVLRSCEIARHGVTAELL
jgi:ABC-type branched-subunit amino acid transport system ATPase component